MTITETPAPRLHGILAAPKVGPLNYAEMLAAIKGAESVSLPALGSQLGMGDSARRYVIREGLIQTTGPITSRREGYRIASDEAIKLLFAAALAIAAGVAIAVMLRGIKQSGVPVSVAEAALRSMT